MKIYDCFTFYNEYDLLELRFTELYDHVDHFVIVEADKTHADRPKPYNFEANLERYRPFLDKVIYVKINDLPGVQANNDRIPNDKWQRECIVRGLANARDEDIIIVSDLDEIPRPSCIDYIRFDRLHTLWSFRMPMFNFRFNYMWVEPLIYQVNPQAVVIGRAKQQFRTLTDMRYPYGDVWANRPIVYDDGNDLCLQHGGWHFSSLGNEEHVKNKFRNFAHSEHEHHADSTDLEQMIANRTSSIRPGSKFEPVIIDDYFPRSLIKNQEKYKDLIVPGATKSVMDYIGHLVKK